MGVKTWIAAGAAACSVVWATEALATAYTVDVPSVSFAVTPDPVPGIADGFASINFSPVTLLPNDTLDVHIDVLPAFLQVNGFGLIYSYSTSAVVDATNVQDGRLFLSSYLSIGSWDGSEYIGSSIIVEPYWWLNAPPNPSDSFTVDGVTIAAIAGIPEPAVWLMLLLGIAVMGAALRVSRAKLVPL